METSCGTCRKERTRKIPADFPPNRPTPGSTRALHHEATRSRAVGSPGSVEIASDPEAQAD
ncbi:MAG: hypothetical protein RMJ98_16970, partial [Myxococcales bacterium]|nr:hypothetical protein [Polyangiaceae bacterium]MDW8250989.1 hypothetical protein [Myxococcales bacterium]